MKPGGIKTVQKDANHTFFSSVIIVHQAIDKNPSQRCISLIVMAML